MHNRRWRRVGFLCRAAPCTCGSAGRWPATSTATSKAGLLRDAGVGPVAGDAVNPSMGAWPRHPCRGHPRNRTQPAFDSLPRSVGTALGVRSVFRRKTDLTPELFRYLTNVSTKVGTYPHPWGSVRGGAVSECGVSAAWARGMPRAGWAGRPTPVLPCAQDCAHEQAAAKPTGTYLRRPRTPTPPHQFTECPLLLLLLLLPLQVQGCKPCQQKTPLARGSLRVARSGTLTGDEPGPRRPSPSAAGPAC